MQLSAYLRLVRRALRRCNDHQLHCKTPARNEVSCQSNLSRRGYTTTYTLCGSPCSALQVAESQKMMHTLPVWRSLKLAAYTAFEVTTVEDMSTCAVPLHLLIMYFQYTYDLLVIIHTYNCMHLHSYCCGLESLARGIGVAGAPFPGLDTPANIDQELDARCCIATLQQACVY